MQQDQFYVYILTNRHRQVLYIGVTNNLERRMAEHKAETNKRSFVSRYKTFQLVHVEAYASIVDAIAREKQLKGGSRQQKVELIQHTNPEWRDLADSEVA